MRFLDSSVFVAAANENHDRFADARACLTSVRERRDSITSAHALAETYAVLTGLPKPDRFSPEEAGRYINYLADHLDVRALSANDVLRLIDDLQRSGVAGGRTYDAIHARTAAAAGATAIVTLNKKHFVGLESSLTVEAPG